VLLGIITFIPLLADNTMQVADQRVQNLVILIVCLQVLIYFSQLLIDKQTLIDFVLGAAGLHMFFFLLLL